MINSQALVKNFGDNKALDDFNITIPEGSVFALIGSNGSGKSTFMRLMAGVYKPDGGTLTLGGETPYENTYIKRITCFVPDDPFFINNANLDEMRSFYKMFCPQFSDERFEYLLSIFPITKNARINTMSKGMQRQAALVLALSSRPKWLLLDEAFDGLDPVIRRVVKQLIAESMAEDQMTTVIASHNLRELEDLCDTIGLMHKGRLVMNRTLDDIKEHFFKVQAVFSDDFDEQKLSSLDIKKSERNGRMYSLLISGDAEVISQTLTSLVPLYCEFMPLTLEEVFLYEMEAAGYDATSLLG